MDPQTPLDPKPDFCTSSLTSAPEPILKIRRPPMCGHHCCGFRIPSAFQQSSVLKLPEGSKTSWFTTTICCGSVFHKSINSQACLQGSKNPKTTFPEASDKNSKLRLGNPWTQFLWRVDFRNTFLAKIGSWDPRACGFRFKNRYKKCPRHKLAKKRTSTLGTRKTRNTESRNRPKQLKIEF